MIFCLKTLSRLALLWNLLQKGELHDRWYSLLYDPVVSAVASARMIELNVLLQLYNQDLIGQTVQKRQSAV
ncbi:Hypothetical predicted protein [Olea europaea subsp. europaea]|uniref:Uncharacterized protein n=1 Tax=Olea europaea subsp. europaea TaxID=158383 RepID=A0A8S0TE19_OLEEU|nr:Hypothetical predicted protein [Olea europaea subsp. europaea]